MNKVHLVHQTRYNGWEVEVDGVYDNGDEGQQLMEALCDWSIEFADEHGETDIDLMNPNIIGTINAMVVDVYGEQCVVTIEEDNFSS